jgi:hypothetical protein
MRASPARGPRPRPDMRDQSIASTMGIEDESPMLQIYDRAGKKRLAFGVPKAGGPVLRIMDENGRLQTTFP